MVESHSDLEKYNRHSTLYNEIGKADEKTQTFSEKLTDFRPVLRNATRGSGKLHMVEWFLLIRDDLLDESQSEDGTFLSMPLLDFIVRS